MSLLDSNIILEQMIGKGNPFLLVNQIAVKARKKSSEYNNKILDSEAVTWAMTGKEPNYKRPDRTSGAIPRFNSAKLKEALCYIDDKNVRFAVEESYRASMVESKPIYIYGKVIGSKQAKVRVIVNKLLDE